MSNNKIKLVVEVDKYCRDAIIRHRNGTYGAQLPYYIISSAFEAIAQSTPYNPSGDAISREALKTELEVYRHTRNYKSDEDEAQNALLDNVLEDIDNAPTVDAIVNTIEVRPQGECVDISKLRLMTVEECAGHTIDYAMGWKACIEWIKKGGTE